MRVQNNSGCIDQIILTGHIESLKRFKKDVRFGKLL